MIDAKFVAGCAFTAGLADRLLDTPFGTQPAWLHYLDDDLAYIRRRERSVSTFVNAHEGLFASASDGFHEHPAGHARLLLSASDALRSVAYHLIETTKDFWKKLSPEEGRPFATAAVNREVVWEAPHASRRWEYPNESAKTCWDPEDFQAPDGTFFGIEASPELAELVADTLAGFDLRLLRARVYREISIILARHTASPEHAEKLIWQANVEYGRSDLWYWPAGFSDRRRFATWEHAKDGLVTSKFVALLVSRDDRTLEKSRREWGAPEERGKGPIPHKWRWRAILPTLRRQFPHAAHRLTDDIRDLDEQLSAREGGLGDKDAREKRGADTFVCLRRPHLLAGVTPSRSARLVVVR